MKHVADLRLQKDEKKEVERFYKKVIKAIDEFFPLEHWSIISGHSRDAETFFIPKDYFDYQTDYYDMQFVKDCNNVPRLSYLSMNEDIKPEVIEFAKQFGSYTILMPEFTNQQFTYEGRGVGPLGNVKMFQFYIDFEDMWKNVHPINKAFKNKEFLNYEVYFKY